MRVLVCGGRDFDAYDYLEAELDELIAPGGWVFVSHIIHGGARGADKMASLYVKERKYHGIEILEFPADWKKHGKAAGPLRNQQMITKGKPDLVLAFAGGKGTDDMCRRARAAGIEVRRFWPRKS